MTVHIIESRLAELLDRGILARGGHSAYSGHRCANEWVAYIAGEPHTAAPACVSPVLRRYTMTLNDRWDDAQRQLLKPYLPRMLGTQCDGLDGVRINLARQALVTDLLPAWLRLAGMDAEAAALAASTPGDLYRVLRDVRDAAWARRQAAYASVRAAVHAKLAGRPASAAVVAAGDYWASYDAAFAAAHPIFEEAIVESTVRRFRPIVLTAAAAVLAMIPLSRNDFFGPMAVAIMGGLIVATALTLLFLPALYAAWYKVKPDAA